MTTPPVTNQAAADVAAPDPSGMEGFARAGTILSIGTAIAGIASSIAGFIQGKEQMKFQKDSAISHYNHQDAKAEIAREMQTEQLTYAEKNIAAQKSMQREYHGAAEERAKVEGQLEIAEARKAAIEKTQAASKLSSSAMDRIFRGSYSYGKPA